MNFICLLQYRTFFDCVGDFESALAIRMSRHFDEPPVDDHIDADWLLAIRVH